jgi:hypothetical protein
MRAVQGGRMIGGTLAIVLSVAACMNPSTSLSDPPPPPLLTTTPPSAVTTSVGPGLSESSSPTTSVTPGSAASDTSTTPANPEPPTRPRVRFVEWIVGLNVAGGVEDPFEAS